MPEGVSPASMAVMRDIFKDYLDWMVVIHDNMLVLCCRNLYLKLSKSSFRVKKVNFVLDRTVRVGHTLYRRRGDCLFPRFLFHEIQMQRFLVTKPNRGVFEDGP
jgi:hypothetical protein